MVLWGISNENELPSGCRCLFTLLDAQCTDTAATYMKTSWHEEAFSFTDPFSGESKGLNTKGDLYFKNLLSKLYFPFQDKKNLLA